MAAEAHMGRHGVFGNTSTVAELPSSLTAASHAEASNGTEAIHTREILNTCTFQRF